MLQQDHWTPGPRWRTILEARWRDRLQKVTELSMAYHDATVDTAGYVKDTPTHRLLRQAVTARQRLADTEDALSRLATGGFGQCEHCGSPIADVLLSAAPEVRYCGGCAPGATGGIRVPAQRAVVNS